MLYLKNLTTTKRVLPHFFLKNATKCSKPSFLLIYSLTKDANISLATSPQNILCCEISQFLILFACHQKAHLGNRSAPEVGCHHQTVLEEESPLLVIHYGDDCCWAFLCDTTEKEADSRMSTMGELVLKDPTMRISRFATWVDRLS